MDDNFVKVLTLIFGAITTLGLAYLAYLTSQIKTQTDGMATKLGDAKFAEGVKAVQDQTTADQAAEARQVAIITAVVEAVLAKQTATATPLVKPNGDAAIPVVQAPATVVSPPAKKDAS